MHVWKRVYSCGADVGIAQRTESAINTLTSSLNDVSKNGPHFRLYSTHDTCLFGSKSKLDRQFRDAPGLVLVKAGVIKRLQSTLDAIESTMRDIKVHWIDTTSLNVLSVKLQELIEAIQKHQHLKQLICTELSVALFRIISLLSKLTVEQKYWDCESGNGPDGLDPGCPFGLIQIESYTERDKTRDYANRDRDSHAAPDQNFFKSFHKGIIS